NKTRAGRRAVDGMPADLGFPVEQVTRIEPALSAWEADVLPLNYTRATLTEPGPGSPRHRTGICEPPDPDGQRRFSRPSPRPRAAAAGPASRSAPAQAARPGPPTPGSAGSPPALRPAQ